MGHAIPVRTDHTAGEVRRFAQRAKDAAQARRLLAIAPFQVGLDWSHATWAIAGQRKRGFQSWDPGSISSRSASHCPLFQDF